MPLRITRLEFLYGLQLGGGKGVDKCSQIANWMPMHWLDQGIRTRRLKRLFSMRRALVGASIG